MARDSRGRFVAPSGGERGPTVGIPWPQIVRLLEHLAYQTSTGHLSFERYLAEVVYREEPRADHPADD